MVEVPINVFLKPEDLKTSETTIIFVDEGRIVPKEETGFEEDSFEINISLPDKSIRTWTMNKTSRGRVIDKYGRESKEWIGKASILIKKPQVVRGKDKEVIYVKAEA